MFDCVIVGSGLVGSTLALCLAASELRVAVIERARHPRFALGESIVTTATATMRRLAQWYSLPELRAVSHHPELCSLGLRSWPKSGFWFGFHREHSELSLGDEAMLVAPGLPMGPDVHVLRSDVDAYLAGRLHRRGVVLVEGHHLRSATSTREGWRLSLSSGDDLRARFIVDCAGDPVLAREAGVHEVEPRLRTNTRALFGHFSGVAALDTRLTPWPRPVPSRDATTIHHCFDGGWIWVIRFDDGVCSVGAVLDRSKFPDCDVPPQRELEALFGRFPSIGRHLGAALPRGPIRGTRRLQRSRCATVGERLLLAPSAAGFVDPLFSSGVDLGLAFVGRAAPRLATQLGRDELGPEVFSELAAAIAAETSVVDRLVSGCYRLMGDASATVQYWRLWIYASLLQYAQVELAQRDDPVLARYGSTAPGWLHVLEDAHRVATAGSGLDRGGAIDGIVSRLVEPLHEDWGAAGSRPILPEARRSVFDWAREVTRGDPDWERITSPERVAAFERRLSAARAASGRRAAVDGAYRRGIERIERTSTQSPVECVS